MGGVGGEVHFNQIKLLIKNNNNNNKIPFNCFQPTGEFAALDHAGEIYPSQNEASSTDLPLELMLKAKINSGKLISKKKSMFVQEGELQLLHSACPGLPTPPSPGRSQNETNPPKTSWEQQLCTPLLLWVTCYEQEFQIALKNHWQRHEQKKNKIK